jgi:hypothetical protein
LIYHELECNEMKCVLYSALIASVLTITGTIYASPPSAPASAPKTKALAASPSVAPVASSASAESGKTLDLDNPPPLPLKKWMPYGKARDRLIAQGWRPVRDPYCTWGVLNLFGDDVQRNYKQICKLGDPFYKDACHVCSHFPELNGCTGDGHCGLTFGYGSGWLSISIWIDDFDDYSMRSARIMDWGQTITRPWPYKQ